MNLDKDPIGPFITVVSVDGGLQCGNKLTVKTPTEIVEPYQSGTKFIPNKPTGPNYTTLNPNQNVCRTQSKGKVSAIPTLVGIDRKVHVNPNNVSISNSSKSSHCAAYVTVVALAQEQEEALALNCRMKSGIPVKAIKNHINTKSIVSISNETGKISNMPSTSANTNEDKQIITISNKVKAGNHTRKSSIVDICTDKKSDPVEEEICWENIKEVDAIPTDINEHVTVYKLPGERLGFGLRFEGGVTSPTEKVRRLYIQSCAVDSPSIKAKTSWGHLGEGDEIIEIESISVNTMTRMDCIQILKDASVAVRLIVRHFFTSDELSLLKAQREIAMKRKNAKKGNDQNKTMGETTVAKNELNEGATSIKGDNSHDDYNDNENLYTNNPNQQVTTGGGSSTSGMSRYSKIPVLRPKQNSATDTTFSNTNDILNGNGNTYGGIDSDSHDEHVSVLLQEHINKDAENEEDLLERLKPPTGFADEFYCSQSSISSGDGNNNNNNICKNSNAHHPNKVIIPSGAVAAIEPQYYLNAISPSPCHGMSLNGSLYENCCESDETGSTRSTVVSRLSMTSISAAMAISGDNSASNSITHINNNNHHVGLQKRKSSITSASSGSGYFCPEGSETDYLPNPQLHEYDHQEEHQQETLQDHPPSPTPISNPTILKSDSNNVSTIPCSDDVAEEEKAGGTINDRGTPNIKSPSLSEIPLAPPLFFQDERVPLNKKNDEGESVQKQTSEDNDNLHHANIHINYTQPVEPNRVLVSASPVLGRFALNQNNSGDRIGQCADNTYLNVRSPETNWEQKGILDYNDDDELALLAEELGLDQEDEDMFNALVAEIDEISKDEAAIGSFNRSDAEVDELIHNEFNDNIPFKGREDTLHEIQPDQLCATLVHPRTSNNYDEKGDETDANSSTRKNRTFSTQENENSNTPKSSCPILKPEELNDCSSSTNNEVDNPWKTNGALHSTLSKNKDEIQDSNGKGLHNKYNRSSLDDTPSKSNGLLFPPFSKVVEPISQQNAEEVTTTTIINASINVNTNARETCRDASDFRMTKLNKHQVFVSGNGVNLKDSEVADPLQAPAPPPRARGSDKRVTERKLQDSACNGSGIDASNNGAEKPVPARRSHDRPSSAFANAVRIECDQAHEENTNVKKEARRYNSLTLPSTSHSSETGVINPADTEAAFVSSKRRADDNGGDQNEAETHRIDDSCHKDSRSLVTSATEQGSSSNELATTSTSESMESSTELLHRHQFIPPTFSRLPPDGDEFPNNCWSDERHQQNKKLYRSELTLKSSSESSVEPGSPPPLPTSEPPRDDNLSFEELNSAPPLPGTVPPIPPKKMATRRCSFDDRKKLFENGVTPPKMPIITSQLLGSEKTVSPTKVPTEEPSKKSVRDKIAMFSSRSSSSEDSTDAPSPPVVLSKPLITNHVSSSLSKSSENLLGTNSLGRKGSIDLNSSVITPSSVTLDNFNTKPTPFYGVMNGSGINKVTRRDSYGQTSESSMFERSQSMVDVGLAVGNNNINNGSSYQDQSQTKTYISQKYSNNTTTTRPVSTLMEQRRKCLTKLRGLVIPDVPNAGSNTGNTQTSASVVDLPTIISKDAVLLSPQMNNYSKPPLSNGNSNVGKKSLSRTESLDRFATVGDNNSYNNRNNTSAKNNEGQNTDSDLNGDWKFSNVMPKYSPAFKRRGLTAYQSSVTTSATLPKNSSLKSYTTSITTNGKYKSVNNATPEPKSLESLTNSPRSDSSFEFSSPSPDKRQDETIKPMVVKRNSFDQQAGQVVQVSVEKDKSETEKNEVPTNGKYANAKASGKLEDSDNDSAVSSSRSSISHGLSPRNSPIPGESTAATPDPDNEGNRDCEDKDESGEDSESWRILKAQSVEAINRKNVLKSAKFSSGGGEVPGGTDDSSISSNGKNRRSDDEEASYADAETEDTESSCSELEVSNNRRRMNVVGRVNLGQRRNSKADTEEDEEEMESSEQSAVNMEFTELTESPLQAIYDMEVKMAYINEVCDALNDRGRSELPSRYFSRRDSEATVIERPIESKRKMSADTVDSADRRARNRSSSGNESDFSSNVSVGSQQNNHKSLSREPSNNGLDADRWSMLEKKYSKSMTAVNLLGTKADQQQPVLMPATSVSSVPKIVTSASVVVEKKIEKIIEKTTSDGTVKRVTSANIPRGRNDFKSIAQKWQLIEKTSDSTKLQPGSPTKPIISDKPTLSPQNSVGSSSSPSFRSRLTSPPPSSTPSSARSLSKTNSSELTMDESPQGRPSTIGAPPSRVSPTSVKSTMDAMDADRAWAEKRRSDSGASRTGEPMHPPMSSAKRSVSVNDIRKAFEKAEIAVSTYGRDGSSPTEANKKDSSGGLTLPAAHFRVSSFDSTTSEESSATTPAGLYGSSNSLVSSAPRDPYGSITSLASSTSLISPQELQQLIDEANQSLEEAGTPSHEVSVVILHREFAGGSLGITLAGGADYETKEITVHKVLTASIADRDGRVHRCDRILSINGKSTKGLTHREALNLLKTPRTEVVLVVSRGRTVANGFQTIEETSALDRAIEPLLNGNLVIENDDDTCYKWGPLRIATLVKDGAGLGFSLEGGKGSIQGDKPLTVKKIFIGGPAEKSGGLKVGDLIVSINNINMSTKSRTEAWNFMKKLSDGDVKICVRSPLA